MSESIVEDEIFVTLEFSKKWLDLGIITINNFAAIKEEYLKGEDPFTEHYRWGAFNTFLKNNNFISPDKFYRLYKLGKQDPDRAMGRAMIWDIIERLDCPKKLIEATLQTANAEGDKTLAKHALKCKNLRE